MPITGAGGHGTCSPWRQCWFMRHWCKINCLHQYNGTCSPPREQMYSYQYSYILVERRTIPLWPNDDRQAESVTKELSYAGSTECTEIELIALLLEAMGFACNEDNADLSHTHVKCIAHHSPVKLNLSHQESRCICYQYFTHDWKRENHFVMIQQRPTSWRDFWKEYQM